MAVKLIAASANYPVTLAEAKAHLSVDFDDHDALIEIYRKAATEDIENFTGRVLVDQTWDYYLDEFPDGEIRLPKPPLLEVMGVFYLDAAGTEQTFATSGYRVDVASELARLSLAYAGSWPTPQAVSNAVRVRFRSGYVDEDQSPAAGSVPFALKAAILLTTGTLYANRETVVIGQTVTMMPWSAQQLARPYRVHTAMA